MSQFIPITNGEQEPEQERSLAFPSSVVLNKLSSEHAHLFEDRTLEVPEMMLIIQDLFPRVLQPGLAITQDQVQGIGHEYLHILKAIHEGGFDLPPKYTAAVEKSVQYMRWYFSDQTTMTRIENGQLTFQGISTDHVATRPKMSNVENLQTNMIMFIVLMFILLLALLKQRHFRGGRGRCKNRNTKKRRTTQRDRHRHH